MSFHLNLYHLVKFKYVACGPCWRASLTPYQQNNLGVRLEEQFTRKFSEVILRRNNKRLNKINKCQ
jgi:hypothetical protein